MAIVNGSTSKLNMTIAGIVPAHNQRASFGVPWSSAMMPLADGYHAIQRSVLECALAGCSTVWVVCAGEEIPLIKSVVGDYIIDPTYRMSESKGQNTLNRKEFVSIYYVPIRPMDRDKRDSMPWSIIQGVNMAYYIANKLSQWHTPQIYYVSFPLGIYDPFAVLQHRKDIRQLKRLYFSHNSETVRDGKYLGFTMFGSDFLELRRNFRNKATNEFWTDDSGDTHRYSKEERYSGRYLTLGDIYDILPTTNAVVSEVDEFQEIKNWGEYTEFMKSNLSGLFVDYQDKWQKFYNNDFKFCDGFDWFPETPKKKPFRMRKFGSREMEKVVKNHEV